MAPRLPASARLVVTDLNQPMLDHAAARQLPDDRITAFCQGTPMRAEIEARDPTSLEAATTKAAEGLSARFGTRSIEGALRAHVATATW